MAAHSEVGTSSTQALSSDNEHELKGKEYEEWEAAWAEEIRRREKEWEAGDQESCTLEEFMTAARAVLSAR